MGKGFDSSDVCLMACGGYFVLACQSLACPTTLDLYYVPVPPLLIPVEVNVTVCVCDLGCVRVVYRCRRWVLTLRHFDLCPWSPCRPPSDEVVGIAIFVDVLLLDQLYRGLCDRHRGSSCLSLRHTGRENAV
jgi:hypothetical protein